MFLVYSRPSIKSTRTLYKHDKTYPFSHNHGSWKWPDCRGNYSWRGTIFHFHDCGRKGKRLLSLKVWNMAFLRAHMEFLLAFHPSCWMPWRNLLQCVPFRGGWKLNACQDICEAECGGVEWGELEGSSFSGWWFQFYCIFILIYICGDDPIWRAYFSTGLVQPPTSFFFQGLVDVMAHSMMHVICQLVALWSYWIGKPYWRTHTLGKVLRYT